MKIAFIFFISFLTLAEDWDSKFVEVCNRDKFCSRLKASDGTWLRPKSEIIALLKNSEAQNEIKSASALYGIDPTAVAGAIAAENSLNVGVKDSVQTWLAGKMGITNIAGKNFSFGLGQIQLPAAREAEDYIAKIEKRKPRSDSELIKEIADPMGSIRITASIIRKVQDDYKNQGFDISKDPGVLATLYNLGQSSKRAQEAKDAGRLPQINYFGLFVDKYASDIRSSAKIIPVSSKVQTATAPTTTVESNVPDLAKISVDTSTIKKSNSKSTSKPNRNLVKTDIVTQSLPLLSAPLLCESSDYGQDIARETKSTGFGAPVGVLEKDESFSETSRTLDCKSNVWKLVKGKAAKIGWVQDEQLEKVRSTKLDTPTKCLNTSQNDISCKDNINKAIGNMAMESNLNDGLIYLKPITNSANSIPSFKFEDFNCGNAIPTVKTSSNANSNNNYLKKPDISVKEIKPLSEDLNNFSKNELERMSTQLKIPIDQLNEPENPYSSIALILFNIKSTSHKCLKSLSTESTNCYDPRMYSAEYKNRISQIAYSESPNLNDVSKISTELDAIYYKNRTPRNSLYFNNYTPDESEIAATTPAEIKESLLLCQERIKNLQSSTQSNDNTAFRGTQYYGANSSRTQSKIDEIFEASKKASDEQIKKYSPEFLGYAKFCHARMNLLTENTNTNTNTNTNKITCTQTPKYLIHGLRLYAKEIVAKSYQQDPYLLLTELHSNAQLFVGQNTIMDILGTPPTPPPNNAYQNNLGPSYCPNRTADFIEDLIKSNPCIKHIYVPTRYLVNKLNALDSKVIYRPFEDDGKYAIEIGDQSCK